MPNLWGPTDTAVHINGIRLDSSRNNPPGEGEHRCTLLSCGKHNPNTVTPSANIAPAQHNHPPTFPHPESGVGGCEGVNKA